MPKIAPKPPQTLPKPIPDRFGAIPENFKIFDFFDPKSDLQITISARRLPARLRRGGRETAEMAPKSTYFEHLFGRSAPHTAPFDLAVSTIERTNFLTSFGETTTSGRAITVEIELWAALLGSDITITY